MAEKVIATQVKYTWVAYEFSTGSFFVYRKKTDLIDFLEVSLSTFNYRWNKDRKLLFWENKYVISRTILH